MPLVPILASSFSTSSITLIAAPLKSLMTVFPAVIAVRRPLMSPDT
ncbi:MAG: hypothetical protein U9R77_14100 [Pseudomonadota bacterium]|nr:hypothetical protein [Pseudomonadota bacterium]